MFPIYLPSALKLTTGSVDFDYCFALVTKCLSTSAREFRYLLVKDSLRHLSSNTTQLLWMRIVAETSLGRIGKKYAEFANAPWRPNGTDPTLHIPTSYDLHHKAITRFLGVIEEQ
uniref:HECT domain-containing protein n=1 Tax=Heterorhabditis bacteriophora TaxID=37862 RepID=A0A1I7X3F9_HETBA